MSIREKQEIEIINQDVYVLAEFNSSSAFLPGSTLPFF